MSKSKEAKNAPDVSFEPIPHQALLSDDPQELVRILDAMAEMLRRISTQPERLLPVIA